MRSAARVVGFAIVCGQQRTPDQTEVIRVNTDLVQTGVMVFDKRGNLSMA